MQSYRMSAIIGMSVLSICCAVQAAGAVELSNGRRILIERGLQIQAQVFFRSPGFSDVNRWLSANCTSINFNWARAPQWLAQMPAGTKWGRLYDHLDTTTSPSLKYLSTEEMPYAGNIVSIQYGDELGDIADPNRLSDMREAYAYWRENYRALAYTNFYPGAPGNTQPGSVAALQNYMQATEPDMLMFDYYPAFAFPTDARNKWYSTMAMYRTAALAGNDGSGRQPIAYGQYLRMARDNSYDEPLPSESYVRLQQFASWAFGYTFVSAWVYNSPRYSTNRLCWPVLFSSDGDSSPTHVFDYFAETNRQSRNLGPALVRLLSTGVYMLPGSSGSIEGTGLTAWQPHAGATGGLADYITAITPYTDSTANGGTPSSSYSDVLIGYSTPLLPDNSGCTFVDGLHFMIVNGAAGTPTAPGAPGDPASASSQWYHITFDFAGSNFNALARLSRDTGRVEPIFLTHMGGSQYSLDLNLPGGTGDLFTFWNSSTPLPTIPEPGAFTLGILGASGLLAYARRKRR